MVTGIVVLFSWIDVTPECLVIEIGIVALNVWNLFFMWCCIVEKTGIMCSGSLDVFVTFEVLLDVQIFSYWNTCLFQTFGFESLIHC
jgi:hypothetical protein